MNDKLTNIQKLCISLFFLTRDQLLNISAIKAQRKFISISFIFLLLFTIQNLFSQNFPVNISTTLTPPYSVYLADYIRPGSNNLQVNIVPTDINMVNYPAKLHLVIEGNNITIETSANYVPAPINLNGGLPEYLTGSDLAPYFDVNNLNFSGYSKAEYIRTGKLPEGIYRFSFYVKDYNRNKRISNIGGATAWLILNDPPILNLPLNKTKLQIWDPQNIIFQWTPRHKGSPNSAFTTEYIFRLYEMWFEGMDPNVIAQTQLPILETSVSTNRLIYGIMEPMLLPGKKYVWTVQAQDVEQRDLFKNDGLSEAYMFTYGDECLPPKKIEAEAVKGPGLNLSWQSGPGETGYEIQHRLKDSNDEWYIDETLMASVKLYDVEYSNQYEYQVRSVCGSFYSNYSEIASVATLIDVPGEFECGASDGTIEITNTTLRTSLFIGSKITVGDFDAEIKTVTKNGETFSGTCLVTIPFLGYAKVPHSFENIKVNELNQMISGKLEAIKNPDSPFMVNIDNTTSTNGTGTTSPAGSTTSTSDEISEYTVEGTIVSQTITEDGTVIIETENGDSYTITENDDGTYTVTDEEGETSTLEAGELEIKDDTGNTYAAGGGVIGSSGGNSTSSTESISSDFAFGPVKIEFSEEISQTPADESSTADAKIEINIGESGSSNSFIEEVSISYKTNNDGEIVYLDIDADNLNQELPNLFGISSTVKSITINYDNTSGSPSFSGSADFTIDLAEDKSFYNGFVVLRKGITGDFEFGFENSVNGYSTNFDFGNIHDINIDIMKGSKTLASLSGATINSDGILNSQVSLGQAVSYVNNGFNVTLSALTTDIEYDFLNKDFKLKTLDGTGSVNSIPGISTTLDLGFEKAEDKIVAEIKNLDNIHIYGLSISAESIKAEFDENFDLKVFSVEDASAEFSQAGASGTLSVSSLVVENNSLKSISGAGSLSYEGYTDISLSDAYYSSTTEQIIFAASISVSAGSTLSGSASINQVKVNNDGSIDLGEISGELQFQSGPLTIEFNSPPKGNTRSKTKTVEARVSLEASEGDLGKTITYETTVSYISDKDLGLTYLNVDASDLDIDFPEIYGISSTVNSINFEYIKALDEAGNEMESFEGSITLSAGLEEDKALYSDVIVLRKGLGGKIILNYSQDDDGVSGSFDFTGIEGLKVDYVKDSKSLATLAGSLNKDAILAGKFVLNEGVEFTSSGFTLMLQSFDISATYNIKSGAFNFEGGIGSARVYNITGVDGEFLVTLDYTKENFSALIGANGSEVHVCNMTLENLNLSIDANEYWEITKIDGSFALKHDDFNSSIAVNKILIQNGELVSFSGDANINYKGFDFKLADAVYNNSTFSCDASVLLDKSSSSVYFAVDDFSINSTGKVSVGAIEGDFSRSVMSIHFAATFGENEFQGEFDATLSKRIGMSGEVHMGSSECGSYSCTGRYPFGYYALTVSAPIPIFPGINITDLGGRFGYNYKYDFSNVSNPVGQPHYGKYLAGLSLGVGDAAGLVNLSVNPALVQWGGSETEIYLKGELKIPATNPMVEADAELLLELPSYDLTGSFTADVNVPANNLAIFSKGFIFKASSELNFILNDSEKTFSGQVTDASILNALKFSGSFLNKRLYNSAGVETSLIGELDGNMSFITGFDFSTSGTGYSISAKFDLQYAAVCKVGYTNNGLTNGHFGGNIQSSGAIDATVLGCSFSPSFSLDASANLDYINPDWKLTSELLILFKLDEDSKERSFESSFEYEF